MAQLEPEGDAPWTFMERLREALGEHAWFEDQCTTPFRRHAAWIT